MKHVISNGTKIIVLQTLLARINKMRTFPKHECEGLKRKSCT